VAPAGPGDVAGPARLTTLPPDLALSSAAPRPDDAQRAAAILAAIATLMPDATFALDANGRVSRASAACVALFGVDGGAMAGRTLPELVVADDREATRTNVARALREGKVLRWQAHVEGGATTDGPIVLAVRAVHIGEHLAGFVGVAYEPASPPAGAVPAATRPATDPLTGLADRTIFRDRVERALARHQGQGEAPTAQDVESGGAAPVSTVDGEGLPSDRGHHVAVLFIDLDDFKTINDSLGHAEGDRLLTEVSTRLLKATRGFDLVARLGGDEFGVLLEGMRAESDARAVVDRITGVLKRPVLLQEREVVVSASLGVAFARDARNADELLRNADVAMYQAKAAGKGRHAEFDQAMHAAAVARLELAADLRFCVERSELRVLYQPVVELASGRLVGAEALMRWERPGHGMMPPLSFIPQAEETGMIVAMGRWVLREACVQLARWRRTMPGSDHLSINVNVSGRQLTEDGFVEEVLEAVRDAGIPAARLTLEITESVLVEHADDILAVLHALRAAGVRLAIDDFGTGYSSLGYLQRFPIDILKIDRSFVDGVTRGGSEAALARTIVALGSALGLDAVAEGIELATQQEALAELGCQRGQGYLFARPLPATELATRYAESLRITEEHAIVPA
jgi:diguanylate cyclase (GGDEF)-like protein/PAS domain S-box-containing protein